MNIFVTIIKENIECKSQMWELAKTHQKKQYKGADAGMFWAFAKPLMYIVVFYFAISIGFKSSKNIPGIDCAYFVWLAIGMIAFFYMRDMITNGALCFRKYPALVAKAKYPISTLPTTVAISFMMVHLGMLAIGIAICIIFGCLPSIYWLQVPFFMVLSFLLAVFWSIATGLLAVIIKDVYNFLQVISQAVFWLSAILFDVNSLSPKAQAIFMFNPITYIVEGYRNAFCRHIWFWQEPMKLACFMVVFIVIMLISLLIYKKLIKRIPDVI